MRALSSSREITAIIDLQKNYCHNVYISAITSLWNGIYTHEASENAIDFSQDSELFVKGSAYGVYITKTINTKP